MTESATIYFDAAVDQAWRLAALIDRNPQSPTRGSFSRTHWAWKFNDFPYPRLQEGVYALTRLYNLEHPRNPFFRSAAVEDWIAWGFAYWASLQHESGAYDEAYPNEQCLAATAFTTFYLGTAFLAWQDRLEPALSGRLKRAFARAGDWLCHNDETHGILSNHLGVAVAALETMSRITGSTKLSARARVFLERIFEHQSNEGWMREYDGADIGYGTHGFFYLTAYWQMTGCAQTRDALDRFAEFLAHFVHPDGTIGGEYGSRNTEFYYPAGFEMFSAASQASASIASGLRASIRDRQVCGVWSMDDFNLMPMLNNLFFAADAAASAPVAAARPLPWQTESFRRYFPHAGLWIVNTDAFYAVIGFSKGGTVSLFDKHARRLAARHAGLVASGASSHWTSQDQTLSPSLVWHGDMAATLDVPWKALKTTVFGSWLFMAFRLFTLTLGRVPDISRRVKDALVYVLIRKKTRPPLRHMRTITVTADGLDIVDDLTLPAGVSEVRAVEQFTAVHMGSALYPDVRAIGSSTRVWTWPVTASRTTRLRARLTLAGADWTRDDA